MDLAAQRTMKAVVTTGTGGFDRLEYRDVLVPEVGDDQALVRVLAAGVNNTEINTRLGWYSPSVAGGTAETALAADVTDVQRSDGGWNAATPFPLIQGTDCCGVVEAVGADVDRDLVDRRVLVRPCMRTNGFGSIDHIWMGSDFAGAFAEYVVVPASEVFGVDSDLSDVELGAAPCGYGTALNLLLRARVAAGNHVLVTGASGGVGLAAVQLAASRGATVTAVCSASKAADLVVHGATDTVDRDADLVAALGDESIDVVVDVVGGDGFAGRLEVLRRGGRYATSGAIGGPTVDLDLRTLYLKDLTLVGGTAWDEPVFPTLVDDIEVGRVRPAVAATFPLADIVAAQQAFMRKDHVGKIVLVPPTP